MKIDYASRDQLIWPSPLITDPDQSFHISGSLSAAGVLIKDHFDLADKSRKTAQKGSVSKTHTLTLMSGYVVCFIFPPS